MALRIKDSVNLKELEKYGFVNDEIYGRKVKIKRMMSGKEFNSEIVEIDLITGQLQIFVDDEYYEIYTNSDTLDFIYDLIKADLVVKVEE
ncbi:MAG: hypothetical protein SPJ27_06600 [Candidatus Onthovivens sp.]|nr:hypothetical protein [Candidatus Onthovivens sp.]